jgi:hypothetical protein
MNFLAVAADKTHEQNVRTITVHKPQTDHKTMHQTKTYRPKLIT